MAKPRRTFDGEPGKPSVGVGGPDQLEYDLDNLFAALDPSKSFQDASPGGLGWENMKNQVRSHDHSADGDAKIPIEGLGFDVATPTDIESVKSYADGKFWSNDNAGVAFTEGAVPGLGNELYYDVAELPASRILVETMGSGDDPKRLWNLVFPHGGFYFLQVEFEAVSDIGGSIEIHAPWSWSLEDYFQDPPAPIITSVPASKTSVFELVFIPAGVPWSLSVKVLGRDAYVYPPQFYVTEIKGLPLVAHVPDEEE